MVYSRKIKYNAKIISHLGWSRSLYSLFIFKDEFHPFNLYSIAKTHIVWGRENLSQATTTCHPKNESWYNFTKVILELRCRYRLGHMHNLILLNTQEYTQRQKRKKIRRSILVFEPCLCRVKEKYAFYTIGHCTQQYVRYKKDEEILF